MFGYATQDSPVELLAWFVGGWGIVVCCEVYQVHEEGTAREVVGSCRNCHPAAELFRPGSREELIGSRLLGPGLQG